MLLYCCLTSAILASGPAMSATPILNETLKLGLDSTWMEDGLGTPGAAGMGSDMISA